MTYEVFMRGVSRDHEKFRTDFLTHKNDIESYHIN